MLRLFIYIQDEQLKVRKASVETPLKNPITWKEKLEFEITTSPLMMVHWTSVLPDLDAIDARALVHLISARFPFSPLHQELKALCPELLFKKTTQEWVFFGGSFNPWHAGHQACLNLLPADKICFVIPDRNPMKDVREIDPVVTIIALCSQIKFGKNQFLAPSFLMDSEKNPTIVWIEKLRHEYPNKKLSLLMGFDSFKEILNWIRGYELVTILNKIYVISRLEEIQDQKEVESNLKKVAPELEIEFLGRHDFEALSSTIARNKT